MANMNTEVPTDALDRLKRAAYGDTGGSQAARYFLFWCVGQDDPTGYKGQGALELGRLDHALTKDAVVVLQWLTRNPYSYEPIHSVLDDLRASFRPAEAAPEFSPE